MQVGIRGGICIVGVYAGGVHWYNPHCVHSLPHMPPPTYIYLFHFDHDGGGWELILTPAWPLHTCIFTLRKYIYLAHILWELSLTF